MDRDVEHMREIIDERDKRYEQRFQSSEKALVEAKDSINRRLDLLNELRDGVATEAEVRALEKIVNDLKGRIQESAGKASGFTASWGILLGLITAVAAVIVIIGTR